MGDRVGRLHTRRQAPELAECGLQKRLARAPLRVAQSLLNVLANQLAGRLLVVGGTRQTGVTPGVEILKLVLVGFADVGEELHGCPGLLEQRRPGQGDDVAGHVELAFFQDQAREAEGLQVSGAERLAVPGIEGPQYVGLRAARRLRRVIRKETAERQSHGIGRPPLLFQGR